MLFAVINILVIKTYRYLPASLAMFMSVLSTVSVVVFAYIFTTETLSPKQWLGALTLFLAVVIVAIINKRRSKGAEEKYILIGISFAVLTTLIFAPAMLNEKYLIDRLGLETYVLYGWGMQAVAAFRLAFMLRTKNDKKVKLTRRMHVNIWAYAVLLIFSGLMYVTSLQKSGSASLTAVIAVANVSITVMLAYVFLRERTNLGTKLLGLLLTCVGVLLLFT
jgi:drug/metabolite transporter (DMT)-like permease